MKIKEIVVTNRTFIFEVERKDSLVAWSEETTKFSEAKFLFPEIVKIQWDGLLPVAKLLLVVSSVDNFDAIVEFIKLNIIKEK